MNKLLVICGPTATGKTAFALQVCRRYGGEIVSADSRQVYTGMDIVTGKDLPPSAGRIASGLVWNQRPLKFYQFNSARLWLYDLVNPDEPFSVSHWKACTDLVIADIHRRGKLPVVVGGTGLYLKALLQPLDKINIPADTDLRRRLANTPAGELLIRLGQLDSDAAGRLNVSDRKNPRRLIRAIEVAQYNFPSPGHRPDRREKLGEGVGGEVSNQAQPPDKFDFDYLQIGLTAPKEFLFNRINRRVDDRLSAGAVSEYQQLLAKYDSALPAFTASGYRAFSNPDPAARWKILEHQYARRQLTWFHSQPGIDWFDITRPDWASAAFSRIRGWYNKPSDRLAQN